MPRNSCASVSLLALQIVKRESRGSSACIRRNRRSTDNSDIAASFYLNYWGGSIISWSSLWSLNVAKIHPLVSSCCLVDITCSGVEIHIPSFRAWNVKCFSSSRCASNSTTREPSSRYSSRTFRSILYRYRRAIFESVDITATICC